MHQTNNTEPLDARWTPTGLDNPPRGIQWRQVLEDVLVAAGGSSCMLGNLDHPGGISVHAKIPNMWRPHGGEWRQEVSGTACLRALLDCPEVTRITDHVRARLLAWLDSTPTPEDPTATDDDDTTTLPIHPDAPLARSVAALVTGEATPEAAVIILRALRSWGVYPEQIVVLTEDDDNRVSARRVFDDTQVAWTDETGVWTSRNDMVRIDDGAPAGAARALVTAIVVAQGYTVVEEEP